MDVHFPALKNKYDSILVDAPCSNLGVIARRPEIKWRFSESDMPDICRLQTGILNHADALLKNTGVLIYSTCSPDYNETYDVINSFLEEHRNYRLDDASRYIPEKYVRLGCLNLFPGDTEFDGFFCARLIKLSD